MNSVPEDHKIKDNPELSTLLPLPFAISDFLGFTNIIESKSFIQGVQAYLSFCSDVVAPSGDYGIPSPDLFFASDSIFIFAKEEKLQTDGLDLCIKGMIYYLSCLIHNSILSHGENRHFSRFPVPLRASFSFGEGYINKRHVISISVPDNKPNEVPVIIGKAVIDAYRWERSQKWIGASIDPKSNELLERMVPKTIQDLKKIDLLVEYDVPTTHGLVKTNAINFNTEGHYDLLFSILDKMENENKNNLDIAAKYRGTKLFLSHCKNKAVGWSLWNKNSKDSAWNKLSTS